MLHLNGWKIDILIIYKVSLIQKPVFFHIFLSWQLKKNVNSQNPWYMMSSMWKKSEWSYETEPSYE